MRQKNMNTGYLQVILVAPKKITPYIPRGSVHFYMMFSDWF